MIDALMGMMSRVGLGSEFARQAIAAFVIKLSGAALAFIMFVAIANEMSAEAYGHFSIVINLAILVSAVFGLGTSNAVLRFWPRHIADKHFALAQGFIQFSFLLIATSSVVLLVLAQTVDLWPQWAIFLGFKHAPIAVAILAICFTLADFAASALRSQHSIYWSMLPRDILWRSLTPLFVIILSAFAFKIDVEVASGVTIVVIALLLIAQIWYLWQSTRDKTGKIAAESDYSTWANPMLSLWGATIVFAMVQQFDVIIVGALAGTSDAGAYFAAQKIASVLGLVSLSAGLVAAPAFSRLYHASDFSRLQHISSQVVSVVTVISIVGLGLLIYFGEQLLGLFDPAYAPAFATLLLLGLATTVDSICGPTAVLMQMTKLESSYLKLIALVYSAVIAAQILLVPHYGMIAAALCNLLGVIAWNGIAVYLLRTRIGVDPSILGIPRLFKRPYT